MAFDRKLWQDRMSEWPMRRRLVPTGEELLYDVERNEGEVHITGDRFDAASMNDLEGRVDDATRELESGLQELDAALETAEMALREELRQANEDIGELDSRCGALETETGRLDSVKAEKSALAAHVGNTGNPHRVTAAQAGALAVDGKAVDAAKLNGQAAGYYATATGLSGAVASLEGKISEGRQESAEEHRQHLGDKANPHGVTAAQVGALAAGGTAVDSAKLNGQVAGYYATSAALDGKLDKSGTAVDSAKLNGQAAGYYATASGLSSAVASLEGKISEASEGNAEVKGHLASRANPHGVTAAQVGALAAGGTAVDSTKLNGQVAGYYATSAALDGKLDKSGTAADSAKLNGQAAGYYATASGLSSAVASLEGKISEAGEGSAEVKGHLASRANPHGVTAAQVGALAAGGTAVDSAKLNGQVAGYYATSTALDGKLDKSGTAADSAKLNGQAAGYYATASGLSSAVASLEGKISEASEGSAEVKGHLASKGNPHGVTAAQVGALAAGGTAVDAAMLGGFVPRWWMPAGVVAPFAGQAVPAGWLLCNGQVVSRTTYALLFGAIGTAYGVGDGTTTFAVPNLTERFILGAAATAAGGTGGAREHTLTVEEMPGHSHALKSQGMTLGLGNPAVGFNYYALGATSAAGVVQEAGGSKAHNNMPPYMQMAYIIKV